ncbi:hypothetical protein [Streptomyces scabiei]|uniref:hypothetical protein n=1 Tax=Streptomyces scabiei TaxID=1930 RepID=UPI0029AB0F54|nr:hypothetical protein [Streptomyces scabiei]MDX2800113.1 hypothetical protein [Streptomyces scabiei]MDX3125384.1 hypothetical protein [Streptomyces scabiei]MDX3282997.1 hypothetical protein [Streptomyces scabiei]
MTERKDPAYISFTDAAALIVRRGLAGSMTPRGLRYMARARSTKTTPADQRWPFGDGPGLEPYLPAGRTRMMRTEVLLKYLTQHPPTGRGPAKNP